MLPKTEDMYWLMTHKTLLDRYLYENFSYEDWVQQVEDFKNEPYIARTILEDYQLNNEEKIQKQIDYIRHNSYLIGLVAGDSGSGKDSWLWFLFKRYKKKYPNEKIYLYRETNIPYWAEQQYIFDINDISSGILIFRELAKYFPARDFMTDKNKQISTNLLDNRHYGIKYMGNSIKLSLVDINYIKATNLIYFKYINPENLKIDRPDFMTDIMQKMIPSDPDDKNEVLSIFNGKYSKFHYYLDKDFTDSYSRSQAMLTEQDKFEIAKKLTFIYDKPQDIRKEMNRMFRWQKPLDFYKQLCE
jgi:hypothetical protein